MYANPMRTKINEPYLCAGSRTAMTENKTVQAIPKTNLKEEYFWG